MIQRLLIVSLLIGLIAAGVQSYRVASLQSKNAALSFERDTLQAVAAQAKESAAVHKAHVERMETKLKEWTALQFELEALEGRDAALSDHMRAAARRLWP
jgi:hypothetical protein